MAAKGEHYFSDEGEIGNERTEIWENVVENDVDSDLMPYNEQKTFTDETSGRTSMIVLSLCVFVCTLQALFGLPDVVLTEILRFFKSFLEVITDMYPPLASLHLLFPGSVYLLWKSLRIKRDRFRKYVVCKKCCSLYSTKECILTLEGKEVSAQCSFIAFPNHSQAARRNRCGQLLMKTVKLSNGKEKLYPFKTYCYRSVETSFKNLLKRPHFEDKCEHWRNRKCSDGVFRDVYDGNIWKYFLTEDVGCFLQEKRNYCIMLNVDWFQPFKHVSYSVGVIYAVILNLPKYERFKQENILLIGIIPDMGKEPPLNTFIKPLVDELKTCWTDGFKAKSSYLSKNHEVMFKVALICTGCDIPATRKLCGFLGHTANLGCSKCLKIFPGKVGDKNYSGFDNENWDKRTIDQHRRAVKLIAKARTATERAKLESLHGVRYSCLLELPYFDPIRMSVIDPMHNMFLGTAKLMIRIWQTVDVLTTDKFDKLQKKVDEINAPKSVGRIPRKIASSFGGFTAEQFMNWTNLFSLMTIVGIIPEKYVKHWQNFVLASRLICSKLINSTEIQAFDDYMKIFCDEFEVLYGKEFVTPNMHLHLHLSQCVKDFGPVQGFWLYSFERYNGHLGSLPNNGRSVELQFMRRFMRDSMMYNIELPEEMSNMFFNSLSRLTNLYKNTSTERYMPDDVFLKFLELATCSLQQGLKWELKSNYELKSVSMAFFNDDEQNALLKMYQRLYLPETVSEMILPQSYKKAKGVDINNIIIGSDNSRYRASALIAANWNASDGRIVEECNTCIRAGKITEILEHTIFVREERNTHLLAKVSWFIPHCGFEGQYIIPVTPYRVGCYDTFGESSFIPIQRIKYRCIELDNNVRGKDVKFVCSMGTLFV